MEELRSQLDRVYEENAGLSRQRAELEVRLEGLEREAAEAVERCEALRAERAEQEGVIEEMQMEISKSNILGNCIGRLAFKKVFLTDESEKEKKQLRTEKEDLSTRNETLKKELKHLKDELNESIASSDLLSRRKEEALDDARQRYEKQMSRLRKSVGEVDEKRAKEVEELRRTMERAHSAEETALRSRMEEEAAQAEADRADLAAQLEKLREQHEEELALAEAQRQQALSLGQQEQQALKERMEEMAK